MTPEQQVNEYREFEGVRLLPGEENPHTVIDHPQRDSSKALSSLMQMMRLTDANRTGEIGVRPSKAALAREVDDMSTPEHLRLYEVLFGRDSLHVANFLLPVFPELTRTTITALAKQQGTEVNIAREEEPGKILHEERNAEDPIAQKLTEERGWGWPYYGSVDATPEFVKLTSAYCQKEGDSFLSETFSAKDGETRTIGEALQLGVDWIMTKLDGDSNANPEGLLEYKPLYPGSTENQVWKDSWDAYHHADGTMANHEKGIASIEVQATAYDALVGAAEIYEQTYDRIEEAEHLRARARKLRDATLEHFWQEEKGGYFVLGTDRDDEGHLRQLRIRTSNMGHVLDSRLLEGDSLEMREEFKRRYINPTIAQLQSSELLNGAGIRTLASDEVRFGPGRYHNGSVWLWDTYKIARGLREWEELEFAEELESKIVNTANVTGQFPEYVRGDASDMPSMNNRTIVAYDVGNERENTIEQPPQEVQAWSVASVLAIKWQRGRHSRR